MPGLTPTQPARSKGHQRSRLQAFVHSIEALVRSSWPTPNRLSPYNDQRGWVTDIETQSENSSGVMTDRVDLAYSHDAKGRITAVDSFKAAEDWTYAYDDLDRLTAATNTGDATLTQTFQYDTTGNRPARRALGPYPRRRSLPSIDPPDRSIWRRPNRRSPDNSKIGSYTYDANHPHAVATAGSYSFTGACPRVGGEGQWQHEDRAGPHLYLEQR